MKSETVWDRIAKDLEERDTKTPAPILAVLKMGMIVPKTTKATFTKGA